MSVPKTMPCDRILVALLIAGGSLGQLQAAGEAYLTNKTGQPLTLYRVPSPIRVQQATPCKGTLLGATLGQPGAFVELTNRYQPTAAMTLQVLPGATAVLGWKDEPPAGGVAHLGIRLGDSGQRVFLVYRAPVVTGRTGSLENYEEGAFQAVMTVEEKGGKAFYTLKGGRAQQALAGPHSQVPDPALDPEDPLPPDALAYSPPAVATYRSLGPQRALAVESKAPAAAPKGKPTPGPIHAAVLLGNRAETTMALTVLPSKAPGPRLLAQVVAPEGSLADGVWQTSGEGHQGLRLRIRHGETAVFALAGPPAPDTEAALVLVEKEGDPRVCALSYALGPDSAPQLSPCEPEDQALLGGDEGGEDTFVLTGACFPFKK